MAKLKVWKFFSVWMVLVLVVGLGAGLAPASPVKAIDDTCTNWSDSFTGGAQQTWLTVDGGDNSTHVFQNNRYELHTESSDGSAKFLASYVDSSGTDYVMQARIQRMQVGDNFLTYLLARANTGTMSAYVLGASSDGSHFWFGKLTGGVYGELTPGYKEATTFDPADFQLKFALAGNKLYGKVWTNGTPEPDHWQITMTDSSYSSGIGGVLLATYPTFDWDIVQAAYKQVSLTCLTKAEVWVDSAWTGKADGAYVTLPGGGTGIIGYNAFATVQNGVNAVTSGGTVNVAAGTYPEALTVNKANVTIQGAGPTATLITTTGATPAATISANGITIKNLGITNSTQLIEGIRVSGATTGLTVDHVNFTNLGNNPGPGNAFGINILNSFSGLNVTNCQFTATNIGSYSRAIGIYAGNNFLLSNFRVENNQFSYLFVGVYLRSDIDGLTVLNNIFGPFDLADCTAAVAGIYIGDGSLTPSFNIRNITVTDNTFTSFGRGVYFWNYAAGQSIGKVDITNNTFTNSIYSSAIRMIGRTDVLATLEGPITINNNTFTQNQKIVNGNGVAMIDFRAGSESATSQITITNNNITFNGPFDLATWGILFRGPITNANISNNTLNGNNAGGSSPNMPSTSGIVFQSNYTGFGPISSSALINVSGNNISGFVNGVVIYDFVNNVYGGLTAGASLNVNQNNFISNTFGVNSGAGEVVNAKSNWWGSANGPEHSGNTFNVGSQGDKVTKSKSWA